MKNSMRQEHGKYQLTNQGQQVARALFARGVVPVFDWDCNLIDLIMPPPNPELTTYQDWYREAIDEAIAEDESQEGSAR